MCAQLQFNICKEKGIKLGNENWYEYVQKLVKTSHEGKVAISWNQPVQTDRTITNNELDIIIHDNEKGTCMLICVVMSGDRNVIKKEARKVLSYEDFTKEVQCMSNVKTKVVGTTGTISKSFRKYLSNIPVRHKIKELLKTAILGTEHILQKVLM